MFWSDETVLNPFGQNAVWPVYLFFGNLPKRGEEWNGRFTSGEHLQKRIRELRTNVSRSR